MDPYFRFLESTVAAAETLAEKSAVLRVYPRGPRPPAAYGLAFDIPYLRLAATGAVEIAEGPVLASLYFPVDYLHSGDPALSLRVITVDTPGLLHPNMKRAVCLGSAFQPGTPFRTLVTALYSLLTFKVFVSDERNAVNPIACRLLREHTHLLELMHFPPLIARSVEVRP